MGLQHVGVGAAVGVRQIARCLWGQLLLQQLLAMVPCLLLFVLGYRRGELARGRRCGSCSGSSIWVRAGSSCCGGGGGCSGRGGHSASPAGGVVVEDLLHRA